MGTRELLFAREKETRNTVRYQEQAPDGQPPVIGYLYVQKWAAGEAERIRVTIELDSNGK